ncbi:hypothetical protein PHISCL_00145 [Aspergillus sclerotialis]|uniref:GPI anchored protein n=1 Tax=Aspergillus sclerotialis TaxID=2070753 RepID=A0A3A2ZWM2_9EURO|nr:hypothetical protein PHISCL_00145 [Aspergillus sclerotialis]
MRYSLILVATLASSVLAQDPGPSPTASVGCEPHGDHWHCDGPAGSSSATSTLPTAPSPTESVGCEPHGDHWHCDGPASADAEVTSTASDSHDYDGSTTPTMPSPTASVGCEPHGDHWHCDGPVETGESEDAASSTSDAATGSATGSGGENAAGKAGIQISAVVGLVLGVAAFNV